MNNVCNICGSSTSKVFDAMVLEKYKTDYFQCENCGFIQTDKPHWLKEAYVSAITSIDVGLIYRNLDFSNIVPPVLDLFSSEEDAYIDYGGGYGMFVRILRDKGYDFYLHDMYAENLFAKHFELKDYNGKSKFAALTAFEVFEHLEDPIEELDKMFKLSDTIIFSTDLQPETTFKRPDDWWYFVPETGQHISFYTTRSLEFLSQKFNCKLYSNKYNLHMFTKQHLSKNPFLQSAPVNSIIERIYKKILKKPIGTSSKRTSLLQQDFQLYKNKGKNK